VLPANDSPCMPKPAPACFAVTRRIDVRALPALPPVRLADDAADALALLVPLLGCGEEAAALAFDAFAENAATGAACEALAAIAAEERVHDALLRQLGDALPEATGTSRMLAASRRFHIRLGAGGLTAHLARIAALDSAVCTILSRLTHPRGCLARDAGVIGLLRRIRNDEARHVALSRRFALAQGGIAELRDIAAAARGALADTIALAADAFETLGVDPAALDRRVRDLPNGLLTA
jgi:hypothetical protein